MRCIITVCVPQESDFRDESEVGLGDGEGDEFGGGELPAIAASWALWFPLGVAGVRFPWFLLELLIERTLPDGQ